MSTDFDYTKPTSGSVPRDGDDWIRNNATGLSEILALDHQMHTNPFNADSYDGEHKKVTLHEPLAADPAPGTNKGAVYTKDVSAKAELHFQDEDGNVIQLTDTGGINGAAMKADTVDEDAIQLDNNSNLTAADAAGTGTVNLIKANADDVPEIPDGAVLATDAAPTEDNEIANKKYVDDAIPDAFTPASYTNEEAVVLPNGFIIKQGNATHTSGQSWTVVFDVGETAFTNTPTITVTPVGASAHGYAPVLSAKSKTGFTINWNGTTSYTFDWIAVGK